MELFQLDNKSEVLVADSKESASIFACIRCINLGQRAIESHGSFSIALSGGSTPKRLYELLSTSELLPKINWAKVNIFWSDERCVPENHPDSNYGMAMHYFNKEPFNKARKFRMHADEKNLEKASYDYERQIIRHCYDERFDLILLGLGADAHTASLFPETKALKESSKLVCANYVPKLDSWRMTLTFNCINQADKVIVLAYGKEKAEALNHVLNRDNETLYPASNLGKGIASILYIVDQEVMDATSSIATT